MVNMRQVWIFAALCTAALCISVAGADAPCYAGIRDTSAAERATMTRVLEAVRRALPPAPPGWQIVNDDPPRVPSSLCKDFERKPWAYDYSLAYRRTADAAKAAEIDAANRAAGELIRADMARKQPLLDAILAKNEALSKRQIAHVEKGEMDKAVALNEQMAVLQEEYRKVSEEGDAQARAVAMINEASRDIDFGVSVQVNPWGATPAGADTAAITVAGNPVAAYRWNSRNEGSWQGGAVVVYGMWRTMSNGGLGLVARGHVPANAVHGITVQINADEDRLASVIGAVDFAALAGLVPP